MTKQIWVKYLNLASDQIFAIDDLITYYKSKDDKKNYWARGMMI